MAIQHKTFYSGNFHTGRPQTVEVDDNDHPNEYSLQVYLRVATAGQEVAVGQFNCDMPMSDEEYQETWPGLDVSGQQAFSVHELTVLIAPGVGIWVCQPVFDDIAGPRAELEEQMKVLEYDLGKSVNELPIYGALIAVSPKVSGKAPNFYDTSIFQNPVHHLALRIDTPYPAEVVNKTIDDLLKTADFLDAKDEKSFCSDWPIPRWLAERAACAVH